MGPGIIPISSQRQRWVLNLLSHNGNSPRNFLLLLFGWLVCFSFSFLLFFCFCFFVLGPYLQYVEIPRLGVQSDLQLPAYTTATATRDLSCICHLHHSSWQCWNLNPLSEARDQTCILMDTSRIHFCYSTVGTPQGTLE